MTEPKHTGYLRTARGFVKKKYKQNVGGESWRMENGCNMKLTWPAEAFKLGPEGRGNQKKIKAKEGGSEWSR